jgi:hypothetical protein
MPLSNPHKGVKGHNKNSRPRGMMTYKLLTDWDKKEIKNVLNEYVLPLSLDECSKEITGYISEIKRPRNLIYTTLCYRYNIEPSRASEAAERLYKLASFNK